MKKIVFYIIITLSVSGCSKLLNKEPIGVLSENSVYKTESDAIQAITAAYNPLLNFAGIDGYSIYDIITDNALKGGEGPSDGSYFNEIANFIIPTSNDVALQAWTTGYLGVHRSNLVLEHVPSIEMNEQLKARIIGEAKFLRALFYLDLVRWFGKVPLIDKPVTANEALSIPQSPVGEIYNLIISDLKFGSDNLPETYAAAEVGRPTKYAAKGMLALTHMTRSGPTYGIEGPGMGLNEWNQALTLLNEIIASNKHSFLPKYSDIFSYVNENNKEVIFDVQYISGGLGQGASFVWLLVPEGYFNLAGLPNQGGIYIRPVSNTLLNSYEAGDVRKTFSIQPGYTYQGTTETRSFIKKYVDISRYGRNRVDWPINFIVQRYTDILMMKAECILKGAPGTQVEVDAIVNQVRLRAGLTPKLNNTLPQLMAERQREFVGEGLRWHDLVRSGMVETVMPAWIAAEDVQKQIQTFQKNYIIYPIPQSELDVKQGLYTQNPGY